MNDAVELQPIQITPPDSYVKDTGTAKGRGVFAGRAFGAGEVVEVAPVLLFAMKDFVGVPKPIKHVIFNWNWLVGQKDDRQAIALGYGSLYNHANPANLRYEADADLPAMRFIAVRDIAEGEELTINYNAHGGGHEWPDNNWFERMKVRLVVD